MLRKNTWTWTFYLLVPVILCNPLSEPLSNQDFKAKTMYQAIVHKCPLLEKTEIKDTLKDIFSTSCVDWPTINATTSLGTDWTNAQCITLYESLNLFCTSLGNDLDRFKLLIPTVASPSNQTVETICLKDTFAEALKNSEHNISAILLPTTCILMCSKVGPSLPVAVDICKISYSLATFDASKFISDSKGLSKSQDNFKTSAETPKVSPDIISSPNRTINDPKNIANKNTSESHPATPKKESTIEKNPSGGELLHSLQEGSSLANTHTGGKLPKTPEEGLLGDQFQKSLPDNIENPQENLDKDDERANPAVEKPFQDKESVEPSSQKVVATPPKKTDVKPALSADKNEDPQESIDEKNLSGGLDQPEFGDQEEDGPPVQENAFAREEPPRQPDPKSKSRVKPNTLEDDAVSSSYNPSDSDMDGDSYFFSYFTVVMCMVVVGYVGYHNRQKILALILEGKRGRSSGRPGRRPNSANYHKLDSNLEEAISSSCSKNASNVIY